MTFAECETRHSYCLCVRREIDGRSWTIYSGELLGKDRFVIGDPLLTLNNVAQMIHLLKFLECQLGIPVCKIPASRSAHSRQRGTHVGL